MHFLLDIHFIPSILTMMSVAETKLVGGDKIMKLCHLAGLEGI